jgi:EAL domain-containing protein (putative c-di-GMP-specific phosphodiesterase class I)
MAANRLLIIDDDLRVLQLLDAVGRRHRYETTQTTSIDRFLEAYDVVDPSLIILDLQYRAGDGIELMSRLRERQCAVPIILLSGFDARVLETARRVGEGGNLRIVGTLRKPLQLQALGSLLDTYREPDLDEWAHEIRGAIDHGQFAVHYQPKVEGASGRVVGFEALTRWSHPDRGLISPDRFIPLAEEAGLMRPLTDYVLARAVADCAAWSTAGFGVSVAVNIAAPSLTDAHLLEEVARLLQAHQLPATSVTLEITESTAMEHPRVAMEILGRLRLQGLNLALDDFGTGFSNLALLQQMPFNELKIDKSFVIGARASHDSQVIVGALAGLAHSLGLTVVAEGVEDLEIWGWLRTVGIDQVQGYGIARPMPANRVLDWLSAYAPPEFAEAGCGIA